jgi:uncharacterized protein YjbI with pentapeptide repeats
VRTAVENANNPATTPADYRPAVDSEDILRRYQAGDRFFQNTDVPEGSSFRDATLAGADFKNSFLSDIDFRGADLRRACFDGSNVKVSDFRGADLRGASFRRALLCGAILEGAKLDDVCVDDATSYGATITDIHQLIGPESSD